MSAWIFLFPGLALIVLKGVTAITSHVMESLVYVNVTQDIEVINVS